MNLSCMGMALKPSQDKKDKSSGIMAANGSGEGRRMSFVSRLRRKFNLYTREVYNKQQQQQQQQQQPETPIAASPPVPPVANTPPSASPVEPKTPPNRRRVGGRGVVPGLPRPPTLKRMQSEKRDRLKPYEPPNHERRALSSDRRPGSPLSPAMGGLKEESLGLRPIQSVSVTSLSDLQNTHAGEAEGLAATDGKSQQSPNEDVQEKAEKKGQEVGDEETAEGESKTKRVPHKINTDMASRTNIDPRESELQAMSAEEETLSDTDSELQADKELALVSKEIEEEMEWRWILNLSMHFRDESNREKFFVTYAQAKNVRRRITISCDYRNAVEGTLEKELSTLRYQRDKSAKIYEAIRDSLQDIMFYETITNLKLQTSDGRLHVHVTEDLNEIIPYPPVLAIRHLRCPRYRESQLEFDSHLSGFVYRVGVAGEIMIKKEIPGPDSVDEFLYEINALYALADSDNVIQFGGCIIDDAGQRIKGLLISFASKGALIDIIYHADGGLPWARREKWAKQIVSGLSEIHEAGYVQGDFTLSNIVIDEHDNAKIIDINRRGCPVGWEPPEVAAMIDGLQRIGMYIGVKSDLFQLGMVLWGIAHSIDEPETRSRPLTMDQAPDDVPAYFREIVETCLCDKPQGRKSAKELISMFPERLDDPPHIVESSIFGGPLPGITSWENANGYFPENAAADHQNYHAASTVPSLPSLSPLTRQPDHSRAPLSPTSDAGTQIVEASPTESYYDTAVDTAYPNAVSSISSIIGGVNLAVDPISRSQSGVAISSASSLPFYSERDSSASTLQEKKLEPEEVNDGVGVVEVRMEGENGGGSSSDGGSSRKGGGEGKEFYLVEKHMDDRSVTPTSTEHGEGFVDASEGIVEKV
jgi:serine/threonine protein kinase